MVAAAAILSIGALAGTIRAERDGPSGDGA
jgi:hypothetical protein